MNTSSKTEVPKYKKKKSSSKSNSKHKSNHKHEYVDCLIEYEVNNLDKSVLRHSHSSYCSICKKRGGTSIFDTIPLENGFVRFMTDEEILEKYKDLEIKKVDNIWDDYVK